MYNTNKNTKPQLKPRGQRTLIKTTWRQGSTTSSKRAGCPNNQLIS